MLNNTFKYLIYLFLLIVLVSSCSIFRNSDITAKQLKEKDSIEYYLYFYDADRAFMLGNFKDAARMYAKCIKLNNKSAVSFYQLSNICIQQKDYSDALLFAKNAVKINPDNIWYQTLLGLLYKQNGLVNHSIDVYNNIINKFEVDTEIYFELASLYLMNNKFNEALNVYNQYEKKYGITELISLEKIKIYQKQSDKESIYKELYKLIDAFPADSKYYGMLAEYYAMDGQYEKALEIYNKILEIDNSNGLVHLSLAEYYRKLKLYDKSFEEVKLAFKSDNVELEDKIKMIFSYYNYTDKNDTLKEEAYTLINILIETYPDEPKIHTLYSDFLVKDKQYVQARDEIKLVLTSDKSKFYIWEQLLLLDNELSDYQLLYGDSKEAMEYFPNQPSIYLFNGIALSQQNKLYDAIETLKNGYNLTDDDINLKIQFIMQLAETYHKNKDNNKSDSTFDKLLKIDPTNKIILNNYSYYLSVRGDSLQKAEKMSKTCIELDPLNYTYLDTYAWVLYRLNKFNEARIYIEKAISNGGGKDAVIVEHYGDILFKTGDKEKAIDQWNIAYKTGKGSKYLEQKIKEKNLIE